MRKGGKLLPLLTVSLLIGLTLFLGAGCRTTKTVSQAEIETALKALAPEIPAEPVSEPVRFEDRDGGLWLSYNDYRALERNVIALREYAARLEIVLKFYREDGNAD